MRANLRRFAMVGLLATFVDVFTFVVLRRHGRGVIAADLAALALAAVVSYVLHRVVTFRRDPFVRWMRSPSVFTTVVVISGCIDLLLVWLLGRDDTTTRAFIISKCIAVFVAAMVRTTAHRSLLLRVVRREQVQPACRAAAPGIVRLSVIVPAYNERDRIASTIEALQRDLAVIAGDGGLEIVVVDDGSADDTADVASRAGAQLVLKMDPNRGKGGAVRAGMLAAHGRTCAFTDADLAYSPTQLLTLVEKVEAGWDVVVGNRRHQATTVLVPTTWMRDAGSRVVNVITQTLLLGQYQDTQCGLKAFRSDVARELFRSGRLEGFAFDVELFHLIERNHLSLLTVPVELRNTSTSTVRAVADGWRLLRDVWRVRQWSHEGFYAKAFDLPPRADGSVIGGEQ